MKLSHIVISSIFLSVLLAVCGCPSRELTQPWKHSGSSPELVLSDSILLPVDFPKYFRLGYYSDRAFIYTYIVVAQSGAVTDSRLAVMDLRSGTSKSISTGNDRAYQKRYISGIHVFDELIYTIDGNAQIISYDSGLVRKQLLTFDYPHQEVRMNGDFLFKIDEDFVTTLWGRAENAMYSPLLKVPMDGKAQYLNNTIKVRYIDNQMKDYPDLLTDFYENKVVIVPQHQRIFFIANLNDGNFTEYDIPDEIPVNESPALNRVLNMQGELEGPYIKNAAFKWCEFEKEKIYMVFHQRGNEKGKTARFQLYSLDVKNKLVSVIDSLPFNEPVFIRSHIPGVLHVLDNRVLYKYHFK